MDDIRRSGFLEPLTYMLKQATEGGGAEKVSFEYQLLILLIYSNPVILNKGTRKDI